ncbi:MAG TPA: hypothetical protein DDX91_08635 [Ruminococcaceae bacterium]|nr:hypothetical protein [Oscillospiraceae bacterium]
MQTTEKQGIILCAAKSRGCPYIIFYPPKNYANVFDNLVYIEKEKAPYQPKTFLLPIIIHILFRKVNKEDIKKCNL